MAITENTLRSLKDKGLLKEPSKLQMLCSSPEMKSLIQKISAPKCDPNRLFRKGDIVEPRKGREVYACEWEDCCFHKLDGKYEVQVDESEGHVSVIDDKTGIDCYVSAFALELVTPVEEREPYYIIQTTSENSFDICCVKNGQKVVRQSFFYAEGMHEGRESGCYAEFTESEAKAAAEAERDRLNDEWRKERENG